MKDLTYITYRVKNILILICTMSMMHQVAIAQVSPSERQALIDLYNATDGDNWSNTIVGNQPWLVNEPTSLVSDWFGVSVVDGKITSLSLVGNNLKGEIPTSFGDLVSLTFLNLGINRLTGQLPQSIGNLTSLEVLQLTRNTLTGGVPSSIGNLTNLIQIDFSINQLTLPLPDVFTNLINAKTFTVERNAITGTIPLSIGSMISLETLILGSNQLTGSIPSELGNLSNLTYLGLYVNGLSGEIPDSLGNLSKLERLLLFRNALTGEVPVSLGNLSNLKGLDVNSNQLTGSIPNEFGSLANLEVLTLSINKFSGNLPQGLSSLASADILNTLVFERNNFVFSDFELQFQAYNDNLTTFSYLNQGQVDQIETRSVIAGQSITLTSNVLTSTNNRYQWFKNNVAIPGATNKDLLISNALDSDAGVYHFTATNNIIADLSLRRNPITLEISCGVSEAEKQALIDLYNSTNGPNWTSSNNWLTDAPVCDWTGVTVKDGKVTGLYLFGGGVAGPLPASIGDLVHLTSLTITRSGGLSGAIPLTIGNLVNLETINLTSNQLTGEIPVEVGNLTNLVSLQLARNQLSGSIPSSIGNLTKLISIGISENRFTGDIPSSIGGLTELEKFDVSINQLNGSIPPELGNLTGLTQLGLTRNALTGSIPVTLSNLVNLTTLDLSSNALTGIIPPELGTMNNLKTLNLFRNQLSGSIPSELGNLQNLESLNLFSNGLTGEIPLSFGNLSNLIVLQLYRNQLSGSIPEALGNLTKLTTLGLSTNQLSGSVPANFGILASSDILNTLTLDRNNFVFNNFETEFPVYQSDLTAFNYLTQGKVDETETLSVTENGSITLTSTALTSGNNSYQWYKNNTAIPGATSNDYIINNAAATDAGVYYFTATNSVVTDLTLERNPITVTVTEGIADCVSAEEKAALVALYNSTDGANWTNNVNWLSNEPVSEWAGVIVEDCKVTRLFLGDNNLVGVLPNEIGDLINLEQLHLNTNSVSSTIPDQIGNLSNLKLLYLYGNEISGVLPESIGNLTNLNNLSLASNKLEGNIPSSFSNLTNIIALSLGGNIGITGDVSFLFKLPNISSLEVWSCNLTEEFTTDFDYVNTSLTKLIISNNGLTGVFDFGKYMPNLQNLSAQDNELNGEFSAYGFTELLNIERLYIERNQIFGSIPVGPKLENLIRLDFSENNLEGQIPDIFTDSSLMRDFQMNNNRFSGKLPLFGVNSLTKVYVFHNNFVYDDFQASYNDAAFSYNFQAALEAAPDQTISKGDTLTILANERLLEDNNQYAWFKSDDGGATFVNTGITSKDYSKENVDVDDAGIYKLQITNLTYPGVTLAQEATSITIDLDTCGVSDAEKQALVDLYNSTDGANWTNNTNWLTDAPVCDWYGVTVVDGKVIELRLGNNNLVGQIPSTIQGLTSIEYLSLGLNKLNGSIPNEIGSLSNLKKLYLNSNSLAGAIPQSIGNLTNLTNFHLNDNNLTGVIPSGITSLLKLEYLHLHENQIEGNIPNDIGSLRNIIVLNLGYNNLEGTIPVSIGNFFKTTFIYLNNNRITGVIPNEIGSLPRLTALNVNNNFLGGTIPPSLKEVTSFKTLSIQENNFIFEEMEAEFDGLKNKLTTFRYAPQAKVDQEEPLSLEENGTITLTSTVLTSTNNNYQWYKDGVAISGATGKDLVITDASETDTGVYHFLATNSLVTDLTLERNPITLTVTPVIDTCGVSESEKQALIDLYNSTDGANWTNNTNWLTDAPVCDWYGITVENDLVISINLAQNNLVGSLPYTINNISNLRALILESNKLYDDEPYDFNELQDLVTLDLSLNELEFFPTGIYNSRTLEFLHLGGNKISENIPTEIGSLENLTFLSLESNLIPGTIPVDIVELGYLKTLNLGNNKLSGSIPTGFSQLSNLNYLDLSRNNLSDSIPSDLSELTLLQRLFLYNNNLSGEIPTNISSLINIEFLYLDNNQLSGAIPVELANLSNLKYLRLRSNNLSGFIPAEFLQLTNLNTFLVENNQLAGVVPDFSTLPFLNSFNFRENKFLFSDFESEHLAYRNKLSLYSYAPQAKVDQEQTIEVQLGGSVTLATTQLTSTNNTYTWYKGTDVLIETTLPQITIDNITAADLGEYYFTATNSVVNDLTLTRNNITLVLGNTDPDGCDILEGVVDGSFENCLSVAGPISEENFNRTIDCSNWELTSVFPVNPLFQSSISTWFVDGNSSNMSESQFSEYISSSPDGGVFTSSFLEIQRRLSKGNGFKTTLNDLTIGEEYIISFYQSHGGSFDDLNGIAVFSDPQWEVNFGNESKFSNSISIRPISNITESIPWEKVELRFTATTSEQDLSFTPNVSYPDEAVFVEGASFHLLIDGIKVIKVNGNCNEEITEQRFCSDNETPPTIGDLVSPIPNTTVTWFTGENNDEALLPPTILANNVTYWARSNNDPLLPRIEVKVILESGTPTGSSTQTFNEIDNPTIADLQATGSNIQWYSLESGETPLANSTALINNTSYYAAEGNSICRLQVLVTINTSGDGDCDILDGIVDGSFQDCALVSGSTQLSYNNNIECSGWQPINALSSPSTWIVDLSDPVSDLNPVMTSQVRQSPDRGIFASALVTHGRGTSNLTKGQGFKTTLNNLEIGKTYTISFYQSQGGSFDTFGNTTVPNSENILAQWNVSFGSETKSSDLIPIQSISDISVAPVWEKQEITFVPTATQQELSFSSFGSLINVVENVFYYNLLIDGIKVIKQNCNPVDPLVQEFCLSDGVPTINDLESPFLNSIAWFENETGGAPLPSAMEITETVTLWAEGNSTNPRVAVQIIIKEDCDGIAIQRFCILNGEVTIGDLQSPFPGSTASWYRTELDKALILPEYVIPESAIYWASSDENPSLPRVPVSIILDDQVPTGDTVQIFDEADAPTVADLQATGLNIQWYLSENGEVTLSNDTPLLHNTYYYAANGYSKCRLRVAVKIEGVITDCNILDQYVDGSFENCESIASSYGHNSNVTCGQWINGKGSADTWKFPFDASHSGIADNIQPSPDNGVAAGAIAKSLNTNELESFYTNLNGLNIGETYRIEFYQSNVTGNFDTTEGLEEARWKVIFGDQIQYSAYMVVSKNPVWQKSTLEFTANTTEARLEFNASSADKTTSTRYVYMLIDGIKLSQVTGGDTGCPDDIVYDTQSFCSMFEDPTVGDLLPPDGATDVLWYSSEVNGYQYSSEDILLVGGNGIPSTDVYWAESSQFMGRKPVRVVINEGIPTGNTLQVFDPLNNPTVANLQAIGNNVQWFASPTSQIPLLENVELIDGYTYYAGHNGLDCRLVVEVEIKLNSPDVNGIQILCASDLPTIGDLVAIPSDPSYTINWYDSIDAVTPLSEDTQIVNSRFYYVSQVTSNGSISDRISVYVSLISVSAPIGASEQTIYTNDGATVRNLVALGNGVLWYDSDGIQLSLDEPLEDGGIYYADQANISGTCRSIDRLAVRVRILPELPPQYFSCEKFRPQPGDKYVVSGWVRENGVTIASTETKSYSEISELFAKLLNELKDIIVTQTPVPPVYIPSPEDRTYDALVPYIKTTGIDNLTIYNLKPVKEDQDGFVRTVGFSFSFDEEGETTFTYKTPLNGFTSNNIYYSFPIIGNEDAISIDFTGLQTCTEGLCVNTNFVYNTVIVIIPISINYPQSIPVDNVLKESVDFNTYTPDPDYQAMTYANSLLKITYTDREGVELEDDGSVSFRPKGNIVDGWQRISTDFRIPDNAEFMTISLQSEDTNLNVYFDDIRFHPFNSNMKTFVYDPETQRLQSELDENNYATFYEYDKEGGLIRVKKETERGVYTIQETRSGNSKLNNN
ncbi:immunoglobulin domain-containing protein [uncultured Aquimarina sp.]|uniref:leucine-rich repeat domain-containing protein n=1 Tax=uncultured Aquimarina sp. TaxID=575652 RepID=UPI00260E9BD0|nr:immunoglobulin domain-containing protein [uncultured Aquimarina sp.]